MKIIEIEISYLKKCIITCQFNIYNILDQIIYNYPCQIMMNTIYFWSDLEMWGIYWKLLQNHIHIQSEKLMLVKFFIILILVILLISVIIYAYLVYCSYYVYSEICVLSFLHHLNITHIIIVNIKQFYIIENQIEIYAKHILLLSVAFESKLRFGLQGR